jgi:hypothetical protein
VNRQNGNKPGEKIPECPYCADPRFLDKATRGKAKAVSVRWPGYLVHGWKFWSQELQDLNIGYEHLAAAAGEQRGKYLRVMFKDDDFAPQFRAFTVEVFGVESIGKSIFNGVSDATPPGIPLPFFFLGGDFQHRGGRPFLYHNFFVCRITSEDSDAATIVHWWPTHGRRLEIYSELDVMTPGSSIDAATAGLEFFKRETRGAPKITERGLVKAIQTLGKDATLTSVAKELDVTRQALQFWARRGGMESWEKVKKRYSTAQA